MIDTASEFSREGYALLRSVLEPAQTVMLYDHVVALARDVQHCDDQVPNTPALYADPRMEELLLALLPRIQEASGVDLLPTYSYLRVYKRGDVLQRHRDRPSCEISVSVNLGYDAAAPWPLWIEGRRRVSSFPMEPGDAVLYRGIECAHWRETFPGERAAQVFLHYVDKNGANAEWLFDKRRGLRTAGHLSGPAPAPTVGCPAPSPDPPRPAPRVSDGAAPRLEAGAPPRKSVLAGCHVDRALQDRIRVVDDMVPRSLCEDIVRSVTPSLLRDATVADGVDPAGSRRVDRSIRNVKVHEAGPLGAEVNATVRWIVRELVEPAYAARIDSWEVPDILVYPPGGFYLTHNDGEDVEHDPELYVWRWRRTMDRDFSLVWYLNEDFEGGDLVFPPFDLSIRPATGKVVVFPSTHEFAHAARPVTRGTRYAVVTWMAAAGTPRVQSSPPPRVQNR